MTAPHEYSEAADGIRRDPGNGGWWIAPAVVLAWVVFHVMGGKVKKMLLDAKKFTDRAHLTVIFFSGPPFISIEYNDEWRDLTTMVLGFWLAVCCLLLWAKPDLIAWLFS